MGSKQRLIMGVSARPIHNHLRADPLNRNREPDMSFIRATMASVEPHLHSGQLISLESTTFPGTIDDESCPSFAAAALRQAKTSS